MPCCTVLCTAALCCALVCCGVLRYSGVPRCTMLHYTTRHNWTTRGQLPELQNQGQHGRRHEDVCRLTTCNPLTGRAAFNTLDEPPLHAERHKRGSKAGRVTRIRHKIVWGWALMSGALRAAGSCQVLDGTQASMTERHILWGLLATEPGSPCIRPFGRWPWNTRAAAPTARRTFNRLHPPPHIWWAAPQRSGGLPIASTPCIGAVGCLLHVDPPLLPLAWHMGGGGGQGR